MTSYKPEGYTNVTPWIIGQNTAGLMDFLKRAFGAVEVSRLADEKASSGMPRCGSATPW